MVGSLKFMIALLGVHFNGGMLIPEKQQVYNSL